MLLLLSCSAERCGSYTAAEQNVSADVNPAFQFGIFIKFWYHQSQTNMAANTSFAAPPRGVRCETVLSSRLVFTALLEEADSGCQQSECWVVKTVNDPSLWGFSAINISHGYLYETLLNKGTVVLRVFFSPSSLFSLCCRVTSAQ